MADYLSDQEQKDLLKKWWSDNGSTLVIGIAIAASAYFGWQWWERSQQQYADQASQIFNELTESLTSANGDTLTDEAAKTATFLIEQLQSDYDQSFYAVTASLHGAKIAVDQGDFEGAEKQLSWAKQHSDEQTQKLVNLRLAKLYLAQDKLDDALSLAEYDQTDTFTSLFAELKGDVLLAKGEKNAAKEAYQFAMDNTGQQNRLQSRLLSIKLSDLLEGENP